MFSYFIGRSEKMLVPDWLITSHVTKITCSDWLFTLQKREDAKYAALEELMEDQGDDDGEEGRPQQRDEPTVDDVEREVCPQSGTYIHTVKLVTFIVTHTHTDKHCTDTY